MHSRLLSALTMLLVLLGTGCFRPATLSTAQVEMAFEMTDETNRAALEQACAWTRQGRYPEALAAFREIQNKQRLNTRQRLALQELLIRLEKRAPPTPATPTEP